LTAKLEKAAGDARCVALILPLIGLAMKCVQPCSRCNALAAEVEALRPEWAAERERYLAEHPESRPKPRATFADEPPDEKEL